ncbi:oligopeptide ABC transporter substrate-binding protein [Ornithinibacillus massiliensis]|uniref:Oligopeptide ABC transporter substrate-binding protein n=1 Tax=Ornithinibacillus massiliensis TaxID=1944633 RepID=A0ABS5M9Z9_9BACI|nr:oligopeptide ABC transporter substrate-binding protein [Ornithinibacillus massiliensis]MBS3679156.1 oligopeptide ABC transporter substrate-binding protein [Ornithinibacillus massiliensis]
MSKTNLTKWLFALMLSLLLVLAACSGNTANEDPKDDPDTSKDEGQDGDKDDEEPAEDDGLFNIEDFALTKTNEGEAIQGGTLNYGLVSDTVFEGTLNYNFYSGNPDSVVISWFDEPLLSIDDTFTYTNDGAATFETEPYETDEYPNGVTFTFEIRDNVNWHDGEPVKAEDWAYSFEVIGHPDYPGVRYGPDFSGIIGMDEYNAGEADTISGIEIVDEKTLKITYKESQPSLLTGGVWPYAMPKHLFKDIPVAEMEEHDLVRKNPIGMGPFKVKSIVPGESVVYEKFEDYWRGEPNLDQVVLKVVNPDTVVQALKTGDVDMVNSFPSDQFVDNANLTNIEWLGRTELSYTYIGFKLGHWDKEEKKVVMDPDKKMADVNLRRAMWYAVDNDAVGKQFYNGLRWNATTLIIPPFGDYHDSTIETPTFDPDEANRILDEAGYEDVNGDGFRETPDGEELVINFASMSGGDVAEPLSQYYIQSWKNVGLNVQLIDGRLLEFNSFYERVGEKGDDDPEIDIYQGAWGTGTDVNPYGLYGPDQIFNFPRYESEKSTELLLEGNSLNAFDVEYRQDIYKQWQELMVEDIPVFPTLYRAELVPVNNRVQNYTIERGSTMGLHELAVTQEEPFKDGN